MSDIFTEGEIKEIDSFTRVGPDDQQRRIIQRLLDYANEKHGGKLGKAELPVTVLTGELYPQYIEQDGLRRKHSNYGRGSEELRYERNLKTAASEVPASPEHPNGISARVAFTHQSEGRTQLRVSLSERREMPDQTMHKRVIGQYKALFEKSVAKAEQLGQALKQDENNADLRKALEDTLAKRDNYKVRWDKAIADDAASNGKAPAPAPAKAAPAKQAPAKS